MADRRRPFTRSQAPEVADARHADDRAADGWAADGRAADGRAADVVIADGRGIIEQNPIRPANDGREEVLTFAGEFLEGVEEQQTRDMVHSSHNHQNNSASF